MAAAAVDAPRVKARLDGWRYPLAIGVLSRVFSFVVVGAIGLARREDGASVLDAMLDPFGKWDGIWYQRIADYGYDPTVAHGNGVAFSPLYPLMVREVASALSITYLAAGVLISTVCFLVALVLLHGLIARRSGERVARTAVWLTAFFPVAYLFSSVYTESLYLLLTVLAFVLIERGWVLGSSVVGALTVLARPQGILLTPALAVRIWKDEGRRPSWGMALRMLPLLLMPLAYVAFGAYLYYRTGDPFATQTAQATGWGRGINVLLVLGLPIAILHGLYVGTHDISRFLYIVDTAFAMTWGLLLLEGLIRKRLPAEYLLYGWLAVLLPVLAGTYLALPRYGMGIFVVMWLAAFHVAGRPRLGLGLKIAMPLALIATAIISLGFELYTP
ncbi:MAG: mannosyltransferase family protein [Actinobacteria bacterium]|nr:mannosyltransferase family protein [Actinomycetota bacterium]